jgi:predicted HicB family RNase H-like nuclease
MTRRPGRPPLDRTDGTVKLTVNITHKTYDRLYASARISRVSLSEYVRRALAPPVTKHQP